MLGVPLAMPKTLVEMSARNNRRRCRAEQSVKLSAHGSPSIPEVVFICVRQAAGPTSASEENAAVGIEPP